MIQDFTTTLNNSKYSLVSNHHCKQIRRSPSQGVLQQFRVGLGGEVYHWAKCVSRHRSLFVKVTNKSITRSRSVGGFPVEEIQEISDVNWNVSIVPLQLSDLVLSPPDMFPVGLPDVEKKKFHDSWWGTGLITVCSCLFWRMSLLVGSGVGSSDNVGHIPVWGEVRSLIVYSFINDCHSCCETGGGW